MSRANNEQMQPLPNQYIFLGTEIHKFYKEIRLVKSNIDDNILPHLTQQTEVLLCAFLPVCIPGTTCLWPGHKEFPTVLLGIDKIDSGCTGRSKKNNNNAKINVKIVLSKYTENSLTDCNPRSKPI